MAMLRIIFRMRFIMLHILKMLRNTIIMMVMWNKRMRQKHQAEKPNQS